MSGDALFPVVKPLPTKAGNTQTKGESGQGPQTQVHSGNGWILAGVDSAIILVGLTRLTPTGGEKARLPIGCHSDWLCSAQVSYIPW